MRKSIILIIALAASLNMSAQTEEKQDSLNIPVYLVDGVEVQSINDIDLKDIISVDVIKNSDLTRLFYPRTGGILRITTKSKKYLKPILQKHQEEMKKAKDNKKSLMTSNSSCKSHISQLLEFLLIHQKACRSELFSRVKEFIFMKRNIYFHEEKDLFS